MVDFSKIIDGKQTMPFISFLIGIGVTVLLFHKPFTSKKYLGLPIAKIEGKVVKHGDKCYTYKSEDVKCVEDKKGESS